MNSKDKQTLWPAVLFRVIPCLLAVFADLATASAVLAKSDTTSGSIAVHVLKPQHQARWLRMPQAHKNVQKPQQFENVLLFPPFRIFYTHHGEHALISKFAKDRNHNQVPDFVEDVLAEAVVSKLLLDSYGFDLLTDPQSLYARLGVQYIDIFIANSQKKRRKSAFYFGYRNNLVYEVLQYHQLKPAKSLLLRIHQPGRRTGKTIAHELFHAYQIASTKLLNRWLVEGSAVWFEYALHRGVGKDKPLPQNREQIHRQITSKAYAASFFWNRISRLCNNHDQLVFPDQINKKQHFLVYPKRPVIADNRLYGMRFMLHYLANLNRFDDKLTQIYRRRLPHLDEDFWIKPLRVARENNLYMLHVLKNTIESDCSQLGKNSELDQFVQLLRNHYGAAQVAAEENTLLGWQIENKKPPGAAIEAVYDPQLQKKVIRFSGTGVKNAFRYFKNHLQDTQHKQFQLQLKTDQPFAIYFNIKTKKPLGEKKERRLLVYSNYLTDTRNRRHHAKQFRLDDIEENHWYLLERDLTADLQLSEPDNQLLQIIDIYVRGNLMMTPVKLLEPQWQRVDSGAYHLLRNPLSIQYSPDRKCAADPLFAKNIWDMVVFEKMIFLASGNSSNQKPGCNAGPVPVIRLEPETETFTLELLTARVEATGQQQRFSAKYIPEEQINHFRPISQQLFFPGIDPTQNWRWGNFYRRQKQGWLQYRTLENTVHTYDLRYFGGKFFAAVLRFINRRFRPYVAISADGIHWQYQPLGSSGQKIFSLLPVGPQLWATTLFPTSPTTDASRNQPTVISFADTAETFSKQDKGRDFFFPQTDFLPKKQLYIQKPLVLDTRHTLYLGAYAGSAHQPQKTGLYLASAHIGGLKISRIDWKYGRILDMLTAGDFVYVLSDKQHHGVYTVSIHRAPKTQLGSWQRVGQVVLNNIVRAFAIYQNVAYLGIGVELDDKKAYFPNVDKSLVGQVLKLSLQR